MSGNRQDDNFVTDFYGNVERQPSELAAESGGADSSNQLGTDSGERSSIETEIVNALKEVYDPEIPVNIYDLGLIYRVDLQADGFVELDMTLTTPGCPVAETFPGIVANAVRSVAGVSDVNVDIVWDPPWTQDRMSEAALLQLGLL